MVHLHPQANLKETSMTLFRREALEHQLIGHADGDVLIRSPAMLWFFSAGAMLLSMGLAWLVCTSHYTQKEHAVGRLVHDRISSSLIASRSGVVQSNLVQQGEKVVAGQPLFEVSENLVLERAIGKTDQKNPPTEKWYIVAPHDGVMSLVQVREGQTIEAGQTMAQLQPPSSRLQAEIFVSAKALLTLKIGDRMILRYANNPYQQFGQHIAIIKELSPIAITQTLGIGGSNGVERRYRVLLDLVEESTQAIEKPIKLRADMELDTSLTLNEKNVIEWICEPLLSMKGKQ